MSESPCKRPTPCLTTMCGTCLAGLFDAAVANYNEMSLMREVEKAARRTTDSSRWGYHGIEDVASLKQALANLDALRKSTTPAAPEPKLTLQRGTCPECGVDARRHDGFTCGGGNP